MDRIIERQVQILQQGSAHELKTEVLAEEPLEIRINGKPYAVIMRTPGHEVELAAGFCFTEGIIDAFSDMRSIGFCADAPEGLQNIVNVTIGTACGRADAAADLPAPPVRTMASRTSCGLCGIEMLRDVEKQLKPLQAGLMVPARNIYRMFDRMLEQQDYFKRTRAAHAAGLFYPGGEPVVVREDVGRHNALDKVIGHALLQGIDCSRLVAVLSSRISFEMVQKALRAGIPVVAAVSAATALAIDLAERNGCTIAGRVRNGGMIIYAHPQRIAP